MGPHYCPGTARLFCEGVDITSLGWTYNGGNLIVRIETDNLITFPFNPSANPAFVSISLSNVSVDSEVHRIRYFSSVLTVDLTELSKQHIKNISCGDLKVMGTQKVDLSDFSTPNVTALYQSGILSRVEVQLVSLLLLNSLIVYVSPLYSNQYVLP